MALPGPTGTSAVSSTSQKRRSCSPSDSGAFLPVQAAAGGAACPLPAGRERSLAAQRRQAWAGRGRRLQAACMPLRRAAGPGGFTEAAAAARLSARRAAGLLTTSTLPTVFVPFQFRDLDAAQIERIGYPTVPSFALYSWMRGTCALSFLCSVTCIVAAFGYLGLLHERSAAGYASCEVAATHDVLITMWLSHATMEAMLLLSFAFALAAVVLGVLRLLDNVTGVIVLVLVACIVALAVYLRAATLWAASGMRFRPAAAPAPAQGAAGAGAAAAKPGPGLAGAPAAGPPADAAVKMV